MAGLVRPDDLMLVNRAGADFQTEVKNLWRNISQFDVLPESGEVEPLTLIEDPTIEVSGTTFTIDENSVVTGGKPSYTYDNEWFGTALTKNKNSYKSYNVGINNKGQAVLPTSTIQITPQPQAAFYTTIDSGKSWQTHTLDPNFGSKGNIVWNDAEKCFICPSLLSSATTTAFQDEGVRLIYPDDPSKNGFVHIPMDYDLVKDGYDANPERFYDVQPHPTLPNTYTAATSGVISTTGNQSKTIIVFTIDFVQRTASVVGSLGPVRTGDYDDDANGSFGRSYKEFDGIGYFMQGGQTGVNGGLWVNTDGLYSNTGTWRSYEFVSSVDWAEISIIEGQIYISNVRGRTAEVYEFNRLKPSSRFNQLATNEFWRQIGDYVYKVSRSDVTRVSSADGSSTVVATYPPQSNDPMFVEAAGGDMSVIFSDGSVFFSDSGAIVGTGNSVISDKPVTLKQTVTDQDGALVVGSAVAG